MDSSPSFSFLPPPPNPNPNPRILPDINTTLSTLKHLIHLSKTTIHSLSTTTNTFTTCPYNPNHQLPPTSLFRHHLHCPSSPSPIHPSLLQPLHYPHSLKPHPTPTTHNLNLNLNSPTQTLSNYHTSLDPNFFYINSPAVVTFPQQNNNNPDNDPLTLTLPAVLSAECRADFSSDDVTDPADDVTARDQQSVRVRAAGGGTNLCSDVVDDDVTGGGGFVKLLPSEWYNVGMEVSGWDDYALVYSRVVVRAIACCYVYEEEGLNRLMEWVLANSPIYGVVIDVFMRDHIVLLFRVCLKAIVREAKGYLVLVSKGEIAEGEIGKYRFDCPVLTRVLMWLGSQFGVLYGEMNGKLFAINMLKQFLLNVSSKFLNDFVGESEPFKGSKEVGGSSRKGVVFVSQVAAAVAALHERFAFETSVKAIRASRFVPAYQRVQEHEYISKKADEERKKRPNYRPIIEHDGVLWHRGGNQDSNKNKTQEELLAEERDYKRRRMSYRGKKIKRSTTQVMRDIIDEYMEEIKHANMACQSSADATNLESEPSSVVNMHPNKRRYDEIKQKTTWKESVSDVCMRSTRYEDEVKERSNKHRQKDNRSRTRAKDRSSSPHYCNKSKHKDKRSSSILPNEFEDRYDPSQS